MNKMVKLLLACTGILLFPAAGAAPKGNTLRNDKLQVSVDDQGRLTSIKNLETGRDYAGGDYLWRLYYDTQSQGDRGAARLNRRPASRAGATRSR